MLHVSSHFLQSRSSPNHNFLMVKWTFLLQWSAFPYHWPCYANILSDSFTNNLTRDENPSVNLSDSRYAQQLDLGWKSVCGFIWTEMIVQGPLHFYLWYDWNYWCTLLPSCRSSSGIRLYIFYFRSYRVWIRPLHYNYTVNGIGNHGGERVSTCASNHRCCVDDHLV